MRRINLSCPTRQAAGAPQFLFEICNLLPGLLGLLARRVEFSLGVGDFAPDTIFAVEYVALSKKLNIQVLDLEVEKLNLIVGPLHLVTSLLEGVSPIFFVVAFVIGNAGCGRRTFRLFRRSRGWSGTGRRCRRR